MGDIFDFGGTGNSQIGKVEYSTHNHYHGTPKIFPSNLFPLIAPQWHTLVVFVAIAIFFYVTMYLGQCEHKLILVLLLFFYGFALFLSIFFTSLKYLKFAHSNNGLAVIVPPNYRGIKIETIYDVKDYVVSDAKSDKRAVWLVNKSTKEKLALTFYFKSKFWIFNGKDEFCEEFEKEDILIEDNIPLSPAEKFLHKIF